MNEHFKLIIEDIKKLWEKLDINQKFSIDFETFYKGILDKYTQSNHLVKTQNGYRLSNEGFLISNVIMAEFIDC